MSERIPACRSIGGTLPQALVPELCETIIEQGVSLEWGDAWFKPAAAADLVAARLDREQVKLLWLCDDRARWGQFDELESYLVENQFSFDRHSEGRDEFDAELVSFRPGGKPVRSPCDSTGQPIIPASTLPPIWDSLQAALQAFEAGEKSAALLLLAESLQKFKSILRPEIPPLSTFEIG